MSPLPAVEKKVGAVKLLMPQQPLTLSACPAGHSVERWPLEWLWLACVHIVVLSTPSPSLHIQWQRHIPSGLVHGSYALLDSWWHVASPVLGSESRPERCSAALEYLHALAAWWVPATSVALLEKPWALHTIPHSCLHTVLSALGVAGRPPSVTVHAEPIGTFRTLVHKDAEGWGHQHNLLHSRPDPQYINYSLGAGAGLITS